MRSRSVWMVVAAVAIGNRLFATGFVGRKHASCPLLTRRLHEDRGLSSASERDVSSSGGGARQRIPTRPTKQQFTHRQGNKNETTTTANNEEARASFLDTCIHVRELRTPQDIDGWMRDIVRSNPGVFNRW